MLQNGQIPILANTLNSGVATITNASSAWTFMTAGTDTNGIVGYTAGAYGGRVFSVMASSTSIINNVYCYIVRNGGAGGTVVQPLGLIPVAASAGFVTATRNIDFLDGVNIAGLPVDNTGKRYISLRENDQLKFAALTAVSAKIVITSLGADYQQIA